MKLYEYYIAYPYALLLILLIPVMLIWHKSRNKNSSSSMLFSRFDLIANTPKSLKEKLVTAPLILRCLVVLLISIALARPQSFRSDENIYTEGIDIAMALDISGSMLAADFKPNRIEAAKDLTKQFIEGRRNDRIGLVVFSKEAFTQCPLTVDYHVLTDLLMDVSNGMIEDGTAIGNALANSINRLKDSKVKSKVIILLTDGVNNAGEIDPQTASELAKTYGIRVYTIGIGTMGEAPYPVQTPFGISYQKMKVEIDEALLNKIADETGGKYYRATSNTRLSEIYKEIDGLERTKIESTTYKSKKELFYPWAMAAAILLLLELLFSQFYLRKLP